MMAEAIARLADKVGDLKLVEGAVDFATLKVNPPLHKRPAAYVMPGRETATPNHRVGAHSQRLATELLVVVCYSDLSDRRGEAAAKALEAFLAQVRTALQGWQITADYTPMDYVRGQLLDVQDRCVWWQLAFRTDVRTYAAAS